jgi:hypothetical protein
VTCSPRIPDDPTCIPHKGTCLRHLSCHTVLLALTGDQVSRADLNRYRAGRITWHELTRTDTDDDRRR